MKRFAYDTPAQALKAWLQKLEPVGAESVAWRDAAGRVLAESILADRDSPPADVSAMDGYALAQKDFRARSLAVSAEQAIGAAPLEMRAGHAVKIVTGACVPSGAAAVVRREDVDETDGQRIQLPLKSGAIAAGANIRRRGENLRAGQIALEAGAAVTPAVAAALAAFGAARPWVHRPVRVGILSTGDELQPVEGSPAPWQIRDSNGPALRALIGTVPWLRVESAAHAGDDAPQTITALRRMLAGCDAVLITGGVSMGDRDHVPDAIAAVGGHVVFHTLPIRPGKPLLAAVGPEGQAIAGLPGNPVSVLCCAVRFAAAALRRRGGLAAPAPPRPQVQLVEAPTRSLPLWRFLPVRLLKDGWAEAVASRGSGDLVSAALADGFVEMPPHEVQPGPHPFYPWEL